MAQYKDTALLGKQIADFKRHFNSSNSDYLTGYLCALSVTEGMIAGLPDADVVEVKHAEWVSVEGDVIFACSNCEAEVSTSWDYENDDMFRFCPCCGAKMDGERKKV